MFTSWPSWCEASPLPRTPIAMTSLAHGLFVTPARGLAPAGARVGQRANSSAADVNTSSRRIYCPPQDLRQAPGGTSVAGRTVAQASAPDKGHPAASAGESGSARASLGRKQGWLPWPKTSVAIPSGRGQAAWGRWSGLCPEAQAAGCPRHGAPVGARRARLVALTVALNEMRHSSGVSRSVALAQVGQAPRSLRTSVVGKHPRSLRDTGSRTSPASR